MTQQQKGVGSLHTRFPSAPQPRLASPGPGCRCRTPPLQRGPRISLHVALSQALSAGGSAKVWRVTETSCWVRPPSCPGPRGLVRLALPRKTWHTALPMSCAPTAAPQGASERPPKEPVLARQEPGNEEPVGSELPIVITDALARMLCRGKSYLGSQGEGDLGLVYEASRP